MGHRPIELVDKIVDGEKGKARDIIAASRTLKRIEDEPRLASPDEKQVLSRWEALTFVCRCPRPRGN